MKSEIPATSAWLWVRWCAWGPATLSCCSFLLFHAMCGKRGHRSCVQPSVCYPERRVGPWAGIRLQEVNRQLERSGPDSGFRNVEAKMKTALELFLPVSVAVRVCVLSLLSSESLSTELENRIKKGFFFVFDLTPCTIQQPSKQEPLEPVWQKFHWGDLTCFFVPSQNSLQIKWFVFTVQMHVPRWAL